MNNEKKRLVDEVKKYLGEREALPFSINSTVRGYLSLSTEEIRVLLQALCIYQSEDEKKTILRDELLEIFYSGSRDFEETNTEE